ncbi:MAG: hypothetical protein H7Z41_11895 [Cytophagales bacterium]|nr:hypothetical protein [Armatimonadota bacterium]
MKSLKTASVLTVGMAAVTLSALYAPSAAQAQAPFRISRPLNGSKVRETARIQLGRGALTNVAYVQLFIDERFRSAIAVPSAGGKAVHSAEVESNTSRVSLLWNTKAIDSTPGIPDEQRVVTDGPHTVEVVALDAAGRRIGRDSVTVNVANRAGLLMPANGISMNYRFAVGDSSSYQERSEVNFIAADNQAQQGGGNSPYGGGAGQRAFYGSQRQSTTYNGRPSGGRGYSVGGQGGNYGGGGGYGGEESQFNPISLVQNVRATFERSTEDRVGGSAFFIRDKVLRGIIIGGNNTAERLENVYDFKSRYRTVDTAGRVLSAGAASRPGAYVALLLPNLGGGSRRTGQTWRTRTPIQLEWATLDAPPTVTADNTLEGLEWQDGYQTARVRQKFDGQVNMPIYGGAGIMKNAKVTMDRTIWFGYKQGKIIRMLTTVTVEGDAPQSIVSQMAPGAASGGGGPVGGGRGGFPGGGYPGGGYPGGGGEEGLLGVPGQSSNGGFGALQAPQQVEEAKVPAKFQSVTTITLYRPAKGATARVASR